MTRTLSLTKRTEVQARLEMLQRHSPAIAQAASERRRTQPRVELLDSDGKRLVGMNFPQFCEGPVIRLAQTQGAASVQVRVQRPAWWQDVVTGIFAHGKIRLTQPPQTTPLPQALWEIQPPEVLLRMSLVSPKSPTITLASTWRTWRPCGPVWREEDFTGINIGAAVLRMTGLISRWGRPFTGLA